MDKLSLDIQYWNEVEKAKLPVSDEELVSPLSDEDKGKLPADVSNFYIYGRWFCRFMQNVAIPYTRVSILYSERHISEFFKASMVFNEHQIEDSSPYETYDVLTAIPFDSAKSICYTICGNTADAQNLLSYIKLNDLAAYTSYFSRLNLNKRVLKAFTRTKSVLRQIESSKSLSELEDNLDTRAYTFAAKSLITDVSLEPDFEIANYDFTYKMVEALMELAEDKYNAEIHEYIMNNYSYYLWEIIAKRFFCMLVYNMRRIWDDLSQEEKEIANEIINPEKMTVFTVNGKEVCPTQHIIHLALRWSKISRKKVLERDEIMSYSEPKTTAPEISSIEDYRQYFAPVSPIIDYKTMVSIAEMLACTKKIDKPSMVPYIHAKDIKRFCYFFLRNSSQAFNIANEDFSKPIRWIGNWQSFKYFVHVLYRQPHPWPSNLVREIVKAFRFRRDRQSTKLSYGEISLKTFDNSPNIYKIVKDDDRFRINDILKEAGLSVKACPQNSAK